MILPFYNRFHSQQWAWSDPKLKVCRSQATLNTYSAGVDRLF
jgi:hypothetical protein